MATKKGNLEELVGELKDGQNVFFTGKGLAWYLAKNVHVLPDISVVWEDVFYPTRTIKWQDLKDWTICITNKQKEINVYAIKEYVEKHRDVFLTIGVVLVLDHFIFEGAFREKLKGIIESFLDKKTKEIGDGK